MSEVRSGRHLASGKGWTVDAGIAADAHDLRRLKNLWGMRRSLCQDLPWHSSLATFPPQRVSCEGGPRHKAL